MVPHGVSYHSLWQDLLGWPLGPSVAGGHPARVEEGMRLGDDGLGRLLVRVCPGAVSETTALEQPREAGVVGAELGERDCRVGGVGIDHGFDGCEGTRVPTLFDGSIVIRVGDWGVCAPCLIALGRGLRSGLGSWGSRRGWLDVL